VFGEGQETVTSKRSRRQAAWKIVEYVDGDTGVSTFGVVRSGRRVAWGLQNRRAAERWLVRNKIPRQARLDLGEEKGEEAAAAGGTQRPPWWNES
jgi:hypothetical protein